MVLKPRPNHNFLSLFQFLIFVRYEPSLKIDIGTLSILKNKLLPLGFFLILRENVSSLRKNSCLRLLEWNIHIVDLTFMANQITKYQNIKRIKR